MFQRDATKLFAPLPTRSMPVYQRIENDLRRRIGQGAWSPGARLPSRQNLAREYEVDLSTIQKAISALLADGTLRADNGRGTFVAQGEVRNAAPVLSAPSAAAPAYSLAPPTANPSAVNVGILVMMGNPADYWQLLIIHALERSIGAEGGTTRFFNLTAADAPPVSLVEGAETLIREGIGALAVISIHETISTGAIGEAVRAAQAASIPLVCVTTGPLPFAVPHVFYDQEMIGFQAADHLLRRGVNRLLFLAPFPLYWTTGRVQGAGNAVRAAGLPDSALRVFPDSGARHYPDNEETGFALGREVIAREPGLLAEGLQGVIGANDKTARGFMRAAEEAGWRLGADYLLIGFDDDTASRQVGLTSLHPPLEALGREAGRLVLASLRSEDQVSLQVRLRSHLVPRQSTVARQQDPASPRRRQEGTILGPTQAG